jgi:outer membrane protein TolC
MKKWILLAALSTAFLANTGLGAPWTQPIVTHPPQVLPNEPQPAHVPPGVMHFTLEEAKQRALSTSKVMALASLNVQSKELATEIMRTDYFPKLMGNVFYFHFDEPLGDVLTLRGHPRVGLPPLVLDANVFNRDSYLGTIYVAQPITALLKVRQGVNIARADEAIARSDVEKARRAIAYGVEQLYLGLLAAQRLRAGAQTAVTGAEKLAALGTVETKVALLEAKQGLQAASDEVTKLQQQLNSLLELPACTVLELDEVPLPELLVTCPDDLINQALATSPEVQAAEQDVVKAHAAVKAAKVDYLPNIAVMGGYANQSWADYIQPNFEYVGVVGSYTFFEWGKKRKTVHKWETEGSMAQAKLAQTQDEVRDKTQKTFLEFQQHQGTLKEAREMVVLRKEAAKEAKDPKDIIQAAKDLTLAEVEVVKQELAYRVAYAHLMNLIGK